MATVITINGQAHTLLSVRDFEQLVEKHMGFDAAKLFREYAEKYEDSSSKIEDLKKEVEDLESEIEELEADIKELQNKDEQDADE